MAGDGNEPSALGRAAALLGRPVNGATPAPAAILPGGRPPNLGSEIRARRFTEDRERLAALATTVPVLSQVGKAQAVVKAVNSELAGFLAELDPARRAGNPPPDVDGLADRAD